MPARIGDTRTPNRKEEDARKAIYTILSEEPRSWGALRKVAKQKGISSATLSKYLKQFADEGIVIKNEESNTQQKLARTYYRLTSVKPFLGDISERDFYAMIKKTPGIQFTEEEEQVWGHMDTAIKILAYEFAYVLASSSEMELSKASKYVETIFQVKLKEKLLEIVKIFQKYKYIMNGNVPISSFAAESIMIDAEESAEKWVPEGLLKKYGRVLPEPKISIAWNLLTSRNEKEAIKKIENEIDEIQRALAASYKQ